MACAIAPWLARSSASTTRCSGSSAALACQRRRARSGARAAPRRSPRGPGRRSVARGGNVP
jgi:hypothetical protein